MGRSFTVRAVGVVLTVSVMAGGCRSASSTAHLAEADYADALAAAEAHRLGSDGNGIEQARAALDRYLAVAETYSPATIRLAAGGLYAHDAYFNDQIKELRGAVAIEDYLARSAEMLVDPVITTDQVTEDDGHFYVRWTMTFRTARSPEGPASTAHGVSHLIFGPDAKIAFQKDYWDVTTAVWEKVPVLGSLVRTVKNRI
jgi:hypothetical protein